LPDVISDTSPLQYLHQLGLLRILPALLGHIVVPSSVERELLVGRELGIDLPDLPGLDWVDVRRPTSRPALPLINDLGPGETETLMLALEVPGSIVLLDDGLARRVAEGLEIPFTGPLGILLDAKKKGLVPAMLPLLDQLQRLRFRLSSQTRLTALQLADEEG
jgi:predicted nucleic acid-binding protein